uniref:Snake toxin/toxin-like domain-containing protein n=2 Tax=Anatidae TaxID=8830 RepID=A0A8B9VVX7_9AVES
MSSPLLTPGESAHRIKRRWRVERHIKLPGSRSPLLSSLHGSALSMKSLLVGLLLGLACVELAQSLRCYTCKEPTDINDCRTPTVCPPNAKVCTTTLHSLDMGYPFFGNITVTRKCDETCVDYDGIGSSRPTTCCYTDLCSDDTKNKGERSSSSALGLMALVVGTLLQRAL